jgi:hypothetical protein
VTEVTLGPGEQALVGYGSLLSIASMERTLGRAYDGPWHLCRLAGWRRGWDVQMPRHPWRYRADGQLITPERVLYLNVRREPDSHVNAALFVVTNDDLRRFDEREGIYKRERINFDLTGVQVSGGPAWTYVALEEFVWRRQSRPPEAIVRQTYLDILARAHAELGAEFRDEYEATTDPVPPHLVVDDVRAAGPG